MARRKDQSFGGRWVAGEFGDLFLTCDGVSELFTGDKADCFANREVAAMAWERARVATWRHEHRDLAWPPVGARVYDGLAGQGTGPETRERLESAVATLDAHRADRADVAAVLAPEYDEYARALELLLGMLDRQGSDTLDIRSEAYAAYCDVITRAGHRGAKAA